MTAREQFQGWHLAVSTILMIAGLLGLDRLVAVYFHESGHQGAWLFVQGTILFVAVLFVLTNLIVDLLYGAFDPRIHYE